MKKTNGKIIGKIIGRIIWSAGSMALLMIAFSYIPEVQSKLATKIYRKL